MINFLVFISFFVSIFSVEAAAKNSYSQENLAIRDLRSSLETMRHEVDNHESELRTFEEKLKSFDAIIENVRDELNQTDKLHKEQLKNNSGTLETKISALDSASKSLVSDLRQFKTYANETAAVLNQYSQRIDTIEKTIEQQNQNIDHLQSAMRALMDALQLKEKSSAATSNFEERTYKVKTGDSLEKIARSQNTTVQAIKELNGLTHDRIVVGKLLQIPADKAEKK